MNPTLNKFINPSSLYILINIYVSAVGFARSFLFMRWLDMNELGIISLVQTIIIFLGFFQIGLLNGGYRIFALDKADDQRDINNVLFTYFAIMSGVALLFWTTLFASGKQLVIDNKLMLVAIICGILTLIMNWLTNTLIGKRLIKEINNINLISATVSFAVLPLVMLWGITGALVALFAQPLIFITITLLKRKELRPTAWNFDIKLVRYILSFGFIPFLAGVFVLINLQIERWSIAKVLGTEALGEFYLVFLYTTLFVLIPSSLLNIFFPKAIHAYENHNMHQFRTILKKHLIIVITYLVSVLLFTAFGLQLFIDILLPKHSANTIYVYYFLPGLVALVLCDPITIIFNSAIRLKPMLYAGLAGVMLNVALIYIAIKLSSFTLINMAIIKTLVNILILSIYFIYIIIYRKAIFRIE